MDKRLSLFYLFDTFCKNRRIAALYRKVIGVHPQLSNTFIHTYQGTSPVIKKQMWKLLQAWKTNQILDAHLLQQIEQHIQAPSDNNHSSSSLSASTASLDPRKRALASAEDEIDAHHKVSPMYSIAAAYLIHICFVRIYIQSTLSVHTHLLTLATTKFLLCLSLVMTTAGSHRAAIDTTCIIAASSYHTSCCCCCASSPSSSSTCTYSANSSASESRDRADADSVRSLSASISASAAIIG